MDIPTKEPTSFRAGDTVKWNVYLDDYPSDEWELTYRLINKDDAISIATSANADKSFSVVISYTATSGLTKGLHSLIGQVSNDDEKYTVVNKNVDVLPDLLSSDPVETRTTAQKLIEILDEALLKHGPNAYSQGYSIAGRTMQFKSHEEFMKFRNQIKAEADRDTRKQQGKRLQTRILTVL